MTIAIPCSSCGTAAKIPTSLFVERFRGRKTSIRCKRCTTIIVVDDTAPMSLLDAPSAAASSSGSLGAVEVTLPSAPEILVTPEPVSEITPQPIIVVQSPPAVAPKPARKGRGALGVTVVGAGIAFAIVAALLPHSKSAAGPVGVAAQQATPVAVSLPAAAPEAAPAEPSTAQPAPPSVTQPAPLPSASSKASVAYDERALGFALRWGVTQAELCHRRGGGPAATIQIGLSFEPSGKVSRVTLEGMSAPDSAEARCIVAQFRSVMIPPFAGESFTTRREIKLR